MAILAIRLARSEVIVAGAMRQGAGLPSAMSDRCWVLAFFMMAGMMVILLFLGGAMLAVSLMHAAVAGKVLSSGRWLIFLVFVDFLDAVVN